MHPTADPGGVGREPNCHRRGAAGSGLLPRPPASAHGDQLKGLGGWLPSPVFESRGEANNKQSK